jgi:hypothetical protein
MSLPTSTRSQQQLVRLCLTQNHSQGTRHRPRHPRNQNTPPQSACPTTMPTRPRRGSAASMRPSPPAGSRKRSKFNWALSKLPFSLIDSINPLCKRPATCADSYQELQDILLRSYGLSTSQRTSKRLDHPGCGNNRPPAIWDHLQRATVKEIQTVLFLRKLPCYIRDLINPH